MLRFYKVCYVSLFYSSISQFKKCIIETMLYPLKAEIGLHHNASAIRQMYF